MSKQRDQVRLQADDVEAEARAEADSKHNTRRSQVAACKVHLMQSQCEDPNEKCSDCAEARSEAALVFSALFWSSALASAPRTLHYRLHLYDADSFLQSCPACETTSALCACVEQSRRELVKLAKLSAPITGEMEGALVLLSL